MNVVSLKEKYVKEVRSALKDALSLHNIMQVPRIEKVVVNVGTGKIAKESQQVEDVVSSLALITGQKPVQTRAAKAIAGFKIRKGMLIGVKVTLRGARMWSFLDRLVHASFPRTKDFQGLELNCVDSRGNMNIGIREHIIFPEIKPEKVVRSFGLQVIISTNATSQKNGTELFRRLGFPIKKQ